MTSRGLASRGLAGQIYSDQSVLRGFMNSSRRNIGRQITAATRTMFRAVTLMCVLVSLARVPVPWLHIHNEHTEAVDVGSGRLLDQHLASCHAGDDCREAEWHLHFVLLDDIVRGRGCPVAPSAGDLVDMLVQVQHVAPVEPAAAPVTLADALPESINARPNDSVMMAERHLCRAARQQFLGEHAESGRLLTVLCVSRC